MGDEPHGDVTHAERSELDVLQRRAYGPDADILDDAEALHRLSELEERARRGRFCGEVVAAGTESITADWPPLAPQAADRRDEAGGEAGVEASVEAVEARVPNWRRRLVVGAAVVALVLGGTAWSESVRPAPVELPAGHAKTAAVANEQRAAGYEAAYDRYLDGLRDEVLALPGGESVAARMIRDQLRPYGSLYGRTVGVGPTVDEKFCMIIESSPAPAVTCISIENAYAHPVSIVLPSASSDSIDQARGYSGGLVIFTLMPGGSVTAEPAASTGDELGAPDSAPQPGATAVPPPGWQ